MFELAVVPCKIDQKPDISLSVDNSEEKIILLIIRDLRRLGWKINFAMDRISLEPPTSYNKNIIRSSMAIKRKEIINKNKFWIDKNINTARLNLASGFQVLRSEIKPVIEECITQKQHDLFRIFRYYWSSPYSDYVGRRIKFIIRDAGLSNHPVIGIAALGSPIIHIPERDNFIGWTIKERTARINYTMDAYVVGALPPYNYLLGGKLIAYLLASKEVNNIYRHKYKGTKYEDLAGLFTTSLYGKSSQYNRISIGQQCLYKHIGETKGYGTLHLTTETFQAMVDYLRSRSIVVGNNFGDGPVWSMRIIRTVGSLLGFDSDELLKHSFRRSIYFVPLSNNTKQYLCGEDKTLDKNCLSVKQLTQIWKERWFFQRKQRYKTLEDVKWFVPDNFDI